MPAKLKYLLKKNFTIVCRNWRWTVTEQFLVAIIFVIIIVNPVERSKNYRLHMDAAKNTQFFKNHSTLYELNTFEKLMNINKHNMRYSILYTPSTIYTREIMKSLNTHLGLHSVRGVTNEDFLVNYFIPSNIICGVVFHDFEYDNLPTKLTITLRFDSRFHTVTNEVLEETLWITRCSGVLTPEDTNQFQHTDIYLREGFLQIQHRIFMEWLRLLKYGLPPKEEEVTTEPTTTEATDEEDLNDLVVTNQKRFIVRRNVEHKEQYDFIPQISVKSMRHLTDHEPCYTSGTSNLIWFLYYFTFFLSFLRLIKQFAREHEENIHVQQWIYGYECGHHRMAHFIISFLRLLILDLLILLIVSVNWTSDNTKDPMFHNINVGIIFIFLLLYTAMLIICAMIVAKLFVDSINSILFGAALWLGSYGLFCTVLDFSNKFTGSVIFSLMCFFNNFFPYGMNLMQKFGKNSDYAKVRLLLYTQIGTIFLMTLLLSIVDYLRPGRYMKIVYFNYLGIPYLCRRKYANDSRNRRKTTYTIDRAAPSWHHYEYGPMNGRELLFVKNIVTYLDRLHIEQQLRNVTMRFFRGEISVLLGSHSTGKTRLISILAGWQKPPAGYIYYDGDVDIFENFTFYRRFVDVSMPNNPLFDLLSVRQTLEYFCNVKIYEFNKLDVQIEVEKWLKVMKPFINDGSILIKDLSFSHKRIVSLCCTLLCDRPIILLDEPTLHMTAPEQRFYWQILQQEKANRVIIVATFSVDEADAIGDRIGILNDGFLVAYGSSFFLRSRFGYGFDLIIMKDPKKSTKPINEILRKYIVAIKPENHIGDQVIYKLPADKKHFFQRMLIDLEKESQNLGITHIRMSGSDLSEIYVTLGMDTSPKQTLPQSNTLLKLTNESKIYLKQQQIQAMLYKKMIHQAPNLIPIVMIFVVFLLILLINEMTKRIPKSDAQNTGVELGFRRNETTRSLLNNYKNCNYVQVNEIEPVEYVSKTVSKNRYFIFKKLFCGKESYENVTRRDPGIYDKLGAVEMGTDNTMTIWVNERIFHTAAIALNLAHNLILEKLYPNETDRITTIRNKPMIIPLHTKINILDNQISHLRVPLTMGIVMPITMSCFIISLVEERYNHLFTLQRIAGIQMHIYWIVGILWDFGTFFTFSLIYILTMALTTIEGFGTTAKLLTFMLMNVHGFAVLTMLYLMSLFMGGSKTRAFLIALLTQYAFGLCAYIFYWDVVENNIFFFNFLSFSPTFSFLDAISNLYTETKEQEYCAQRCQLSEGCNQTNICGLVPSCCFDTFFKFEPPGILTSLVFMMASSILFVIIFVFVNVYRKETKYSLVKKIKEMGTVCYPSDDPDVVKKRTLIASLNMSACKKYTILADQIEEKIPQRSKRLNTVSFALDKQISMGIYGSRHCGKSHLIHQLAGDHGFRFGELYICAKDCKHERKEAYKYVGFCPQDRGLCDAFTPQQLFTLLFMIRGIPPIMVNEKLAEISRSLNLRKHISKKIGTLPIAIKRKVNIAIALIVYNKVLILDEPTRGMPPMESRIIWNVLRYARYCGNTIVFSSSDNLECETLSDNMIVVDQGEMLAIGSPHYLKNKYTKGFYLEVKLLADGSTAKEAEENLFKDVENLIRYASFLHEDSVLINRSDYTLKFYIPVEKTIYSYLFGSLEKNRNRLNISEYTIRQVSLLTALENIHAARLLRVPYKTKKSRSFAVKDEKHPPPDDNAPGGHGQLSPKETLRQTLYDYGDDDEKYADEANADIQFSNSGPSNRLTRRSLLYQYGDDDDDEDEDAEDDEDVESVENLTNFENPIQLQRPKNHQSEQLHLSQPETKTKFQLQAEIHRPPEEANDELQTQDAEENTQEQPAGPQNKSQKDKKNDSQNKK